MKSILTIAAAVSILSGVAINNFAAATPETGLMANYAASRPSPRRHRAHRGGTTIPYLKNSRPIRVRRLSRREVRDVYRRLIDIRIN